MELRVSGRGEADLAPRKSAYPAGSMVSLSLYPAPGTHAEVLLNGEPVSLTGHLFSFGVTGDTLLEVSFPEGKLPAREVLFPEGFRGDWNSADGSYSLTVGERELLLCYMGAPLSVFLSAEYDPFAGGTEYFYVNCKGERFELAFFGNQSALALSRPGETVVFVPAELPEITPGKALYGKYQIARDSESYSAEKIVISADGCFWGEKEVLFLEKPRTGGQTPSLVLCGGRVYALFLCTRRDAKLGYELVLRDPITLKQYTFR